MRTTVVTGYLWWMPGSEPGSPFSRPGATGGQNGPAELVDLVIAYGRQELVGPYSVKYGASGGASPVPSCWPPGLFCWPSAS